MIISLNNTITIDEQVEVIKEQYQGEVVAKGDWLYLIYHNAEQEKVVIKLKPGELVMTRFSQPQTHMRFVAGAKAPATLSTPLGLQSLVTNSRAFLYDRVGQSIRLVYDLLTSQEAELPLATYELELSWRNGEH